MNPMTEAVLKAGLITSNMLREMKRFSPTLDREAEVEEPKELELAAKIIADALESADYTIVRETDLGVLQQYMDTATKGTLVMEDDLGEKVRIEVTYGKTKTGEYVLPWRSESIGHSMVLSTTYLELADGYAGETEVRFADVRELYFGTQKAFMLCIPRV
jgi:hypothetical protein